MNRENIRIWIDKIFSWFVYTIAIFMIIGSLVSLFIIDPIIENKRRNTINLTFMDINSERIDINSQLNNLDEVQFQVMDEKNNIELKYIVKIGDTLSSIAAYFYDDPIQWYKIFNANNIDNPDLIFPEQEFYIPMDFK